jgi:hypothetical protein
MDNRLWIAILIIIGFAGLAAFVGLILGVVWMAFRAFAKKSGINALTVQYPATQEPANVMRRQTAKIGAVQFQRLLNIAVLDAGLYLSLKPLGVAPQSTLIPWSQMRPIGTGRLYWRSTRRIAIGNPQIAVIEVFENLWRQMAPHLAPTNQPGRTP